MIPYDERLDTRELEELDARWERLRSTSTCEDCAMWQGIEAEKAHIDGLMAVISHLCRKSTEVDRPWSCVLDDIRTQAKMCVESHGHCSAYDFLVTGDTTADGCDDFAPLPEVVE